MEYVKRFMIYATPRAPQTQKQNQQIIFLASADSCNFSLQLEVMQHLTGPK